MIMTTIPGALTTIYSDTNDIKTGARHVDKDGNEYIFLKGVANVAVGSWVGIDHDGTDFTTVRTVAATLGQPLAVAISAVVADKYGWFQIFGLAEGLFLASCAADAAIFCTATDGKLDDTSTNMPGVVGIHLIDTIGGAAALGTCVITYPRSHVIVAS